MPGPLPAALRWSLSVNLLPIVASLVCLPSATPASFQLNSGDCVVFIGSALIEREQRWGYWEAALTARNAGKSVRFRNLGWSGDTVSGEAQAGFGSVEDGFRHLRDHVLALKPTVIVVGYGTNESFDGPAGLTHFLDGFNRLLDALKPANARFVLLSPLKQEDLGRPLPDPAAQNRNLRLYADAIRDLAGRRGIPFVDLYELPTDAEKVSRHLTDNEIHLTPYGYWRTARVLERGLGLSGDDWLVELDATGKITREVNVKTESAGSGGIRFRAVDSMLPLLPPAGSAAVSPRVLRVRGLADGSYTLLIDGRPAASAPAADWSKGVALAQGPEFDQAEQLRRAIVAKNQLYFHRWRPQNETYLFGFRKHEQGQNAREIPKFDPLVAEAETEIARLANPVPHSYDLKRDDSK
jgi:lysophospholipase L1-like esterase